MRMLRLSREDCVWHEKIVFEMRMLSLSRECYVCHEHVAFRDEHVAVHENIAFVSRLGA